MNMARRNALGEMPRSLSNLFGRHWMLIISGNSQTNVDRRSGESRDDHASRIMLLQ
jgi:hypothetical protein